MKKILFMAMSLVVMSSGAALARGGSGGGYLMGLNAYYSYVRDEPQPSTATKVTKTYFDLNLGYLMSSGLYLGGIYTYDTLDSGAGYIPSITAYGASVGYYLPSGWFFMGHYLLNTEFKKYSTSVDSWNKGTGYQLEGGYLTNVSGNFNVGVQLTYRNYVFTNYNDGTTDSTTNKYTRAETFPQIKFAFIF